MFNFGLDGKKLNGKEVKKYFNTIAIDPARRKFLTLILYGKRYFFQNSKKVS